jgi:dipeptidyl aminopeptidase/acylaminoacyl peptidase
MTMAALAAALVAASAIGASGLLASAAARSGGATRIVFVYGKDRACKKGKDHLDCSHPRDVIRSISPSGGRERVLASVRSVAELSATKGGRTVAILSKNVVGGGSNTGAFTQIYLLSPSGKLKPVFAERLQEFAANGLSISADGKLLVFSGKGSRGQGFPKGSKVFLVGTNGSGMRQLSKGEGDDSTPAFSPDGKRVVFSREAAEGSKERDSELYEAADRRRSRRRQPGLQPRRQKHRLRRIQARQGQDRDDAGGRRRRADGYLDGARIPRPRLLAERPQPGLPRRTEGGLAADHGAGDGWGKEDRHREVRLSGPAAVDLGALSHRSPNRTEAA